jgi:hypothetical protein
VAGMVANIILTYEPTDAYNTLVSSLGKYDNCIIRYSFEAALRSMSPEYVYDNYSKYLIGGRKTFEGKEILYVMEEYAEFQRVHDYSDASDIVPFYAKKKKACEYELKWDSRWVKILADIDETRLTSRIISEGDSYGVNYLLRKLEENKEEKEALHKDIVLGLFEAKYDKLKDVLLELIEFYYRECENFYKKRYYNKYNHFSSVVDTVRLLKPEDAKDFEELAAKYREKETRYSTDASQRLEEAILYLKNSKNQKGE